MSQWIGEVATSDLGWSHLEDLVDIGNRMAGSDGERTAAELTREAFASIGARNARLDTFELQGWSRISAVIEADETEQACIALPRSPAGAVEGTLVDVGYGLPADFDRDLTGAIVIVSTNVPEWHDRFIHRREKYYRAVEAGASGFIFANHIEGCLAPTGSIGKEAAPIGEIPAVGVSKEVGARLRRRWSEETVRMTVEADTFKTTSQNVHAELGPDTDEEVLLTSHVDAHDIAEGAWDNGAGTAMVLEVARALKQREDELETKVHLIAFGAEEVGLVGSSVDADRRDLASIKAVVNNDGVVRGRDLKFYNNGFDELHDVISSVGELFDHPLHQSPNLAPHSDHWPYVQQGVPGTHVMSETASEGRGWGHTAADTLDKLDVRDLREQAICLTELVVHLADSHIELEHAPAEQIATELEEQDLAEGMKLLGEWPYDSDV